MTGSEESRSRALAVATGLLPGGLLGAQVAGLLFFLNPGLPFDPGHLLAVVGIYAPLLAVVGFLLQWPFVRGNGRRWLRILPWSLSVALAAAAVLAAGHASHFAFYLDPGINRRLIKAAAWYALGALICFYTALLHTVHHRGYGRRSRIGIGFVALASLYAMVERREAFQPPPAESLRAAEVEGIPRPQVMVIGLDAATIEAVLPLAERGVLPFFSAALEEGAVARLRTIDPSRSGPLWTSLGTGKYPYQHGLVSDFVVPMPIFGRAAHVDILPLGRGLGRWVGAGEPRPAQSTDRTAFALWEILPRLGSNVGVVGWPGSAPVGVDAEAAVSDRFFVDGPGPGRVRPEALGERAQLFASDRDELRSELPGDLSASPHAVELAAADRWRASLAGFLVDQVADLEVSFLFLPGLRSISEESFGGFAAVEFQGSTRPEDEAAHELLVGYYEFLDRTLADLWEGSGPDRLLVVVSVYGVRPRGPWHSFLDWARGRPSVGGLVGRGEDGILVTRGFGIRAGAVLRDPHVVDLAPTLLYALGLPVARDLSGRVLTELFSADFLAQHPLGFVPSYESLPGKSVSDASEGP